MTLARCSRSLAVVGLCPVEHQSDALHPVCHHLVELRPDVDFCVLRRSITVDADKALRHRISRHTGEPRSATA